MKLCILVGLPGSGKSTVVKELYPNWVRINQDSLGNRQACVEECLKAFNQGKDVIIDRSNVNKSQRSTWINLGLNYGVESITCVFLNENPDLCVDRINLRKGHETIAESMPLDKKRRIVYDFYNSLEIPSLDEGINKIIVSKSEYLLKEKT